MTDQQALPRWPVEGREPGPDRPSTSRTRFRTGMQPTRRRVLGHIAGVASVAGVVGWMDVVAGSPTDTETATEADDGPDTVVADIPLVDAHTHLIPTETLGRDPLDAAQLVAWMNQHGIDRAVVLALDSPESYPVISPSWWVLEEVAAYPNRLIPFCTVDPRTIVYGEDVLEERIERNVEHGCSRVRGAETWPASRRSAPRTGLRVMCRIRSSDPLSR